jgi:hypothetical protein
MTDVFIDATRGKPKRYLTGRCHYCDHNIYPSGKLIDPSVDKNAIRLNDGTWMCGICNFEETKKMYDMNNLG